MAKKELTKEQKQYVLLGFMLIGFLGWAGYTYLFQPLLADLEKAQSNLTKLKTEQSQARKTLASRQRVNAQLEAIFDEVNTLNKAFFPPYQDQQSWLYQYLSRYMPDLGFKRQQWTASFNGVEYYTKEEKKRAGDVFQDYVFSFELKRCDIRDIGRLTAFFEKNFPVLHIDGLEISRKAEADVPSKGLTVSMRVHIPQFTQTMQKKIDEVMEKQ